MNCKDLILLRPCAGKLTVVIAAAVCLVSLSIVLGDDTTKASVPPGVPKKSDSTPPKKKLTGAELYAINCSRCHAERYPTEFKPGQWKTLMTHMRVRANLPASQAREILKYLQENSGN